jgi:hypothetical protein
MMRTYVIRLQRHDDLLTIQDRITWCNTTRIILVFPEGQKLVNSNVDFVRIGRFAAEQGHQIALVIQHEDLRKDAQQAGLIVFETLDLAQKYSWKRQKHFNKDDNFRKRFAISRSEIAQRIQSKKSIDKDKVIPFDQKTRNILLGVLGGCILLLLIFFAPAATITIEPEHQKQQVDFYITASPDISTVYSSGGLIPARVVTVQVESELSAKASGQAAIPDAYAGGNVLIKNTSDDKVVIPAGTIVFSPTDPVKRYVTQADVTLDKEDGLIGTVAVRAASPGSNLNIEPAQVTAIEKDYGLKVEVVNEEAISGGTDQTARSVSHEDYIQLKDRLTQSLKSSAMDQIEQEVKPGEILADAMVQLVKIDDENLNHAEGQAADDLTLKIKATFSGWVVQSTDIETLTTVMMASKLGKDEEIVPRTLTMKVITDPVVDEKRLTWQVRAEQQSRKILPVMDIKADARGKLLSTVADQIYQKYHLATRPKVNTFPAGWPVMPFYYIRIDVLVN